MSLTHRRLRLAMFAVFGAALLAVPVGNAFAFSLFGLTLFEDQSAQDAAAIIADPQSYDVEIIVVSDNDDLINLVQNASSLWKGREKPASGGAGLLATARSDYRRVLALLYAKGYYGGALSIVVNGREATDLSPDAALGELAHVVMRLESGPRFLFSDITIENQAPIAINLEADSDALNKVGLASGQIARAGSVRRAARVTVDAWRELGYPKASVDEQDIIADHNASEVSVRLTLKPGPRAVLGVITVEGVEHMQPGFVERQTGLVSGQPYSLQDIARARARLSALEVFSAIKIVEGETVNADGTLPITIVVQERKTRRVGVGTTFSTIDGVGVETFWVHRNLFGQAERIRFDAKVAGITVPADADKFDYYIGGSFVKPGVLTPDTDFTAAAIAQRAVLTRYTETSFEAKVGFAHKFSPVFSGEAGLQFKRAEFKDASYGTRDFALYGAYGSAIYDTRDDARDATKGVFLRATAEPYYESEFGNAALLLSAEGRTYFAIGGDDGVLLAGRLKIGLSLGPSVAQTPPDKLFFAGGGGSVRGYSFRSIGVEGPGGTVTGGRFLTEASLEARVKVSENIGIVAFIDAGYVAAEEFVGLATGTRVGIGVGVRYNTGFGPLRLDVAIPLNKRAGDSDFALYAGIGQAF